MIIEKNYNDFVVNEDDTLEVILKKIDGNKNKIVFVLNNERVVLGSISDGDIRRWMLKNDTTNLNCVSSKIYNKSFKFIYEDKLSDNNNIINSKLSIAPVLNKESQIVAIVRKTPDYFSIGKFNINEESPTFIIAEIGNNHNGNIDFAKKLVDEAIKCGANCVKFQMRNMKNLYGDKHNKSENEDLGSQYVLGLLEKFQLNNDDLKRVFDYAHEKKIMPLCTPWDFESVKILEDYGMEGFKVASADFTNHDLLFELSKTRKPLICSTGMTSEQEIIGSVDYLKSLGSYYSLLHCNSTYPANFKDININYMSRLANLGECIVGYSGHERGYSIPIAAVAKGARIIEKHFTLDKNMEGNDHIVSLLPEEFSSMVRGIRETEQSLGNGFTKTLSQGERMNRETLGKSLVINCDLKKGNLIKKNMIEVRSPGIGLEPYKKNLLIGKQLTRNMKKYDVFYPSDLDQELISEPREYSLNRPWGIPVRYHDVNNLTKHSNPDLVEFHLSYNDLELNPSKYLNKSYKFNYLVHAPELFANDHILDLSSKSIEYREKSIKHLWETIKVTKNLKSYFPNSDEKIRIIVNAGGASLNSPVDDESKSEMYSNIINSLSKILDPEIEIIIQTMPPLPWHFGGQRFHNLFINPDDIVSFCKQHSYRICLDISHAILACNYYDWDLERYIMKLSNYTAHIHFSDSYGVDGEGVQFGEGELDLKKIVECLNKYVPNVSFIPEVWQGHKNFGSGFWYALDKLESEKI